MDCPQCGTPNPPGARFCLSCGTRQAAPRPAEGERRFVTVLFADVVGSTALAEYVDPEQVAEIMNGAFAFMNAAVDRYGGTVARLMGDAILALFGAPVAHDDDAERAVRAALDIREQATHYAETVQRDYRAEFQVRVGIHSGLAVLAMVGDEVKTEYTAMGDTANVASRLQSAAEPGTILISGETEHLIQGAVEVRSLGSLELKGKSAPVETYEVVAATATSGRTRGLEGHSSPLVGRDAETAFVRSRLEAAATGEGSVIAVLGEAGLGKSRLMAELRSGAGNTAWLEGRALSFGQTIAYYPWRQIVRQSIGAGDLDPPDTIRALLSRSVPSEDQPFLEALLSTESSETLDRVAGLHGDMLVLEIAASVRRLILRLAENKPLALVFDDLHWADEASFELLARLADVVATAPVVMICIARPDRSARSWAALANLEKQLGGRYARLALEPLSARDSEALLSNLLDVEGMPESVHHVILQKSEGNPFFLEEVIRSLVDSGHIVREDGHWRATQDIVTVAIPDTLTGVLASRIDRLPEETKRVAQMAAVIGRIFRYPVLSATVASDQVDSPDGHIATLTDEELVRERARAPELEYIFKHALTQEAAYDLLLLRRRKEYHRRVADVLQRLYPEQLEDLSAMLAHHYWNADEWEQAARFALIAARTAARVYAISESLEHFDRAYQALKHLPNPPAGEIIDAVLGWTELAIKRNRFDEALERLAEVEPLARELGDRRRLGGVLTWMGSVHVSAGFPTLGMPYLMEGFGIADELDEPALAMLPLFMMTAGLVDRDPRAALQPLQQAIDLSEEYDRPEIQAHALATMALAHSRLGNFVEAEEFVRRAHLIVPRVNSPAKLADVNIATALVYYDMGLVDEGLHNSREAARKGMEGGVSECTIFGMYCTGLGLLRKPDLDEAARVFEDVRALTESMPATSPLRFVLHGGVAMLRTLADEEGAIETMQAARDSARAIGDVFLTGMYSQVLAEARIRQGELDLAEKEVADLLSYYRGAGMRPHIARALDLLALLRERQGRPEEAAEARSEAFQLNQEMRLPTPAL